jgi:SEL1 protein
MNLAADSGHAEAQHQLAIAYSTGLFAGYPIAQADPGLGVLYEHMAVQSGHLLAHVALGYRYWVGRDVMESCDMALEYYAYAANSKWSY